MRPYQRELDVAVELARRAGAVILEVYGTSFDVVEKQGGAGPVTLADERANALIVEGLKAAFPGEAVVAEEGGGVGDAKTASRCWYVDPLDGTREFVNRNGEFAVHIGLAVDAEAMVGVVFAPQLQVLYAGVVGQGATVTRDGVTRAVTLTPPVDVPSIRLAVSRSHKSKKTGLIREALGIHQVVEHGSVGLKVGLLVDGRADLYLHPSPESSRWDNCAPEAVLRGAGGMLLGFDGQPYRYDGQGVYNERGLVGGAAQTLEWVMPVVTRVAQETGLVKAH